jgi:hypothetical protein
MLRKIRINGMKIIAFVITPFGVIYFIAIGLNGLIESIGVILFGLVATLVFGVVMLLVEKVVS